MSKESEKRAEEFFERLEKDKKLQGEIRQGIEKLAKDSGYDLTEEELTAELRKRWQCQREAFLYSEPPGF
jgi:hypothetical protein